MRKRLTDKIFLHGDRQTTQNNKDRRESHDYTDSVRIPVTRVIRACNGEDESEVCR